VADEKDLKDLAKARAKSRAEERMKKIGSGDFTRGFGGSKELDLSKATKSSTTKSSTKSSGIRTTSKSATATRAKTGTTKSTSTSTKSTTKKSTKTQIGGVVVDKSAIEAPLANTQGRERRNKLIITTLSVFIAIIWIVVILMAVIKPGKPNYNCHVYISGDAASQARAFVDTKYMSEWSTPDGIAPRTTLNSMVAISFSKPGIYNLRFRVEIFKGKENVTDAVDIEYLYPLFNEVTDDDGVTWLEIFYPIEKLYTEEYQLPLFTALHFWGTDNTEKLNGISTNNIKIDIYVDFSYTTLPDEYY